jgi:hypothetical protein
MGSEHGRRGSALIGRSLLECQNERSQAVMHEVLAALQAGEEERLIADNEKHRISMRAVRDPGGGLLGYYERYEAQPLVAIPRPVAARRTQ